MDNKSTQQVNAAARKKSNVKKEGIFKPIDYVDDLMHEFDEGYERGTTTHLPMMDNMFQWLRTYVNCWFGYGSHGKSELIRQLFLYKARFESYRWVIFAGENMSHKNGRVNANRYISSLAHTLLGKNPDPYFNNQPTKEQYREAINFINEHFVFVYPPTLHKNLDLILEYFQAMIDTTGADGCLIDPWNKLMHVYTSQIDEYLSMQFDKIKYFSVKNNIIFNICAHMSKEGRFGRDGKINKPSQHMLAGGPMWDNAMDTLVSVYKPNHGKPLRVNNSLPEIEDDPNLAIVTSHKIREHELVATPGDVTLYYNFRTRRFEFLTRLDEVYQTRIGYNPLNKNADQIIKEYEANEHFSLHEKLQDL